MLLFLLYESAAGLSLFKFKKFKEGKTTVDKVLKLFNDKSKFMKKVKLVAFQSFGDSEVALETL